MTSAGHATVLFADITDSVRLYKAAGDRQAVDAIDDCLKALRQAAEASGGRVVKTIGDAIMVLFSSPDAAADAATRMHTAVAALAPLAGERLAIRAAFHAGPVIHKDNDVFGDTVNTAARLVAQASKGQVLTTDGTVALLKPMLRSSIRRLYDITVRGKADDVGLCEFLWQKSPDVTDVSAATAGARAPEAGLRLRYRGRNFRWHPEMESIAVGRDAGSQIVITEPKASRHHCVIERRRDKFFVKDHSTNGTFVSAPGEEEIALRREELLLRGRGWIAFGLPRAEASEVLEYFCEDEAR